MKLTVRPLFFILLILLAASCNVTKHLPEGARLYTGANVKMNTEAGKKSASAIKSELEGLVRPKPNTSILGIRYKLWFYYVAGEPRGKGVRKYIREKLGEPPVLASEVNLEKNRQVLENRLQNKGFFHAIVTGDTVVNDKKRMASLRFEANTGPQYMIRNVTYPKDTATQILKQIARTERKTALKNGKPYDLETIKGERNRIDLSLKNHGYYYFNADYLLVQVDSTVGGNQVDMYVKLKEVTPYNDRQPYIINNIWLYPTYTIEKDSLLGAAPSEKYLDYNIIDPDHQFKPKTFSRMLIFHPGQPYSRRDHDRSLNRLVNLGTFKFVKARFEEVDTNGYFLDPYYFLTPLPKKSWRLEVTGLTRSNNSTGGEVSINWRNRNFLHGAELFTTSIFGGAETQVSGTQSSRILRYGIEANLLLPRVVAPFRLVDANSEFIPRTKIGVRYEFYNRNDQYTLSSYTGTYGFIWKHSIRTEHQLNLLNVNYVQAINITPEYQKVLDTDITLRRAIEPQFILGPSYNYNYNSLARANTRRHNWYFNGNVEAPGNLIGLFTGSTFGSKDAGDGKLFNTPFSQYARFEVEGRHYLRLNEKNTTILASRLLAGVGIPYGNSTTLPFIKAFFAGGANDIRAFRARSLGPGTYNVRDGRTSGIIPDQPGDIKLEANTELRSKLISILNGALFVDAGNVWTARKDDSRPGSQFTSQFLNQVGVGAGAGLRVDITFLVVRLDLAMPIRVPFLKETDIDTPHPAWVFDRINFGDPTWRKENLILNLAIGYPF